MFHGLSEVHSTARAEAGLPVPSNGTPADPPGLLAAIEYIARGLRPVPLHAKGEPIIRKGEAVPATGKEPIGEGWGRKPHTGESLRRTYAVNPMRGVGLQLGLGPRGEDGILDLEIDDEFQAQFTLTRIFGEPRPPETMRYRSRRGMHHIYRLAADDAARLRERGVTRATIDGKNHAACRGIELRFGTLDPDNPRETQSAAPPTPYERDDGVLVPRRWEGTTIAPFPSLLMMHLVARFGRRSGAGQRAEPTPPPRDLDLTPVELFLHQAKAMGLAAQEYGGGWMVQCPAHPDNTPSLSVRAGDDGCLLVRCFGCEAPYAEIMAAAGLEPRDGFPDGPGRGRSAASDAPGGADVRSDLSVLGHDLDDETAERLSRERDRCVRALARQPERRDELARRLNVSPATLVALGVGWREDREKDGDTWAGTGRWAWVFPEVDGRGRVIGLLRRYEDDRLKKKLVVGGRRGLTVPTPWRKLPGPIVLCEGASDTAALLDLGFCAIGRPQAKARTVLTDLAELLEGDARDVVVAADNDAVGRSGAEDLAWALGSELFREVRVLPPLPPGVKDLRQLVASALAAGGLADGR